jgi:O-antigen ligase
MVSLSSLREQPLAAFLSRLVPAQIRGYRPSIVFCACAITLMCSLVLGGGTRGGFLSDAILELLAIPALLVALTSLVELPAWRTNSRPDVYWVLAFCFAIVLLPLIQLVPLPPWLWTRLPGRAEIAKIYDLIGGQTPWLAISVSPYATWLSFLSLLPPMAIFLAGIQLGYRERRGLTLLIIAVGVVSVFLGLLQVAQGEASPLRFFSITNPTEAVGFFANRNHFAALLYTVLLFAAVWAIDIGFKTKSWTDVRSFESATVMAVMAIFVVFIVVLAGEAMARSRAGLALTIVALLAVFVLGFADRRNAPGTGPSKLLLVATILAIILSVQFALYRILGRFATDPVENARIVFAHNTIAAAKWFLPFGSGLGTFVPVYATFERAIDTIPSAYANHAHDDILELWLETGVMGAVLFGLFLVWFGLAAVKLWWKPPDDLSAFDCTLGRAATVVIALLLAHSLVDYPMRTEAIMAVFAVSCALLIAPLRTAGEGLRDAAEPGHAVRRKSLGQPAPAMSAGFSAATPAAPARGTDVAPLRSPQAGERWGDEIDWPEQWRNPADAPSEPDPNC